jgi:heme-degrading monooxygenase HmoA
MEDQMRCARIVFFELKPKTVDVSIRRATEELLPRFRRQPGFVSYQLAKVDDRSIISISTWETKDAAENANRVAAEWAKGALPEIIVSSKFYFAEIAFDSTAERRPIAGPEARP